MGSIPSKIPEMLKIKLWRAPGVFLSQGCEKLELSVRESPASHFLAKAQKYLE